ncbi:hypothetical protein Kisp01_53630 [Kineosporia sp. NBRC 101677]|uniref:hypothetical protein n=1 Tax=Kineosporia sp. NBRC 101677 TaxID=3032197 RepID=UPI0024A24F5C|nr:hypothetical protein [Kineosporia sp. NBRC 101677]GLY18349.1 hypothetical protein Kisp01_53630 [Kineosporia sp. NBRC 101677]
MSVELVALVPGAAVLLACVSGRWLANRNRSEDVFEDGAPNRPLVGAVTSEDLAGLPLVAPERAGYGTASRLLVLAAQERSRAGSRNLTVPARDHREGGSQAA